MTEALFEMERLPKWIDDTLSRPEPPWIIRNFIPAGGLVLITGEPKLGHKSWLANLLAMSSATGVPASGFEPTGRNNTWFISREGPPHDTATRWQWLSKGHGLRVEDCDNLWMTHLGAFFLDDPRFVKAAIDKIVEHRITLVVIDTLAQSMQGDENSARDTMAAMRGAAHLRDAGAAVVLVHHLSKSDFKTISGTPAPDRDIRGSSAILGAIDVHIAVRTYELENGAERFMLTGGKIIPWTARTQFWHIDEVKESAKLSLTCVEMPHVPDPKSLRESKFF